MENSNDTIGNQTRDLPTCSAVQREGEARINYRGSEPDYTAYVFVFLVVSIFVECTNCPFQTKPQTLCN